ncbi:MAG: circularly permuted type 2 ATP-grasp protein [Bryobacteraceae bacterium]
MSLLDDAVARYHKNFESPASNDLGWVEEIQAKMASLHLAPGGRSVCPVLRPHFLPRKQADAISKSAEALYGAFGRLSGMLLSTPALFNRLEMLPAEKMLATVEPGYSQMSITCALNAQVNGSGARFVEADLTNPAGFAFSENLADALFDSKPVKELRKKYKLSRSGSKKKLLNSVLAAYKGSGKKKFPRIAIVETRPPFKNEPGADNETLAEHFRQAGYPTEVVTPEQLDYRNGVLCRGDFGIEIVYRRVSAQEFLFRFELAHPLLRAYRDGAVCVVNSFRSEILQKKAILALLTDETVVDKFPAAERKAIREHIPWTRVVAPVKTLREGKTIDLPEFILHNRQNLVLKPNDNATDMHSYRGWELEAPAWERAVKTALRSPYVVQDRVDAPRATFPVWQFGKVEMKQMAVDVHPLMLLGKTDSLSATVRDATSSFSTLVGTAPVFVIEGK